jgi:hypothetical protein
MNIGRRCLHVRLNWRLALIVLAIIPMLLVVAI